MITILINILAAPKITSDLSIRDMTVIAGEEFTITVPFTGSPTPKPVWSINGEEILPDSRIKFETSATETVFKNKCAKRKTDTGNYTIHLINNIGADSASCKVLVVGKLSKNNISGRFSSRSRHLRSNLKIEPFSSK